MKIAPGLHSMGGDKGGRVRAFLLDLEDGLTLIDTLYDDDGKVVLDEIAAMGKQPGDLKRIVLTHAHKSHIGGVAALRKATGARVYSHEWESEIIAGRRKAKGIGIWPRKPLAVYHLQLGLALGAGKHTPCEVDQHLKDGDRLGALEVVTTPGHTPGCLSFYWKEKRALIAGDIIATWPEVAAGWPGLTLDQAENERSIGKLGEARDAEILCVGHGEPLLSGANEVVRKLRR